MLARATPLATPAPQEPEPEAKEPPAAAAPGLPPRPIASPVMSLTAPRGAGDTLLGGAQRPQRGCRFGRDARAGEGRGDRGAGRPRRRLCLAAPRHRDGDRRPAARSGRAAAEGRACGRRQRREQPATAAPAKQAAAPRRERRAEQPSGWNPWGGQTGGGQTWGGQTWAQQQQTATAARFTKAPALGARRRFSADGSDARRADPALDGAPPQAVLSCRAFGRTALVSRWFILISRQNCRVSTRATIPMALIVMMAGCAPIVSASKPT